MVFHHFPIRNQFRCRRRHYPEHGLQPRSRQQVTGSAQQPGRVRGAGRQRHQPICLQRLSWGLFQGSRR